MDKKNELPESLHVKTDGLATWIYNEIHEGIAGKTSYIKLPSGQDFSSSLLQDLYQKGINSLIVEGGTQTLQSFIQAGLWDEAFCIETPVVLHSGTPAPVLHPAVKRERIILDDNIIQQYTRPNHEYL